MVDQEPTINDFEIGQLVNYFGITALISGFTFHPETYELNGITLDEGELNGEDIVVRDHNYKHLIKI